MGELEPTRRVTQVRTAGFAMANRRGAVREYRWEDIQGVDRVRAANFGPHLARVFLFRGARSRYDLLTIEDVGRLLRAYPLGVLSIRDRTGEVHAQSVVEGRTIQQVYEAVEAWLRQRKAKPHAHAPPDHLDVVQGALLSRNWTARGRKYIRVNLQEVDEGVLVRLSMAPVTNDVDTLHTMGVWPRLKMAWLEWASGLWTHLGADPDAPPSGPSRGEAERMIAEGRRSMAWGFGAFGLIFLVLAIIGFWGRSLPAADLERLSYGLRAGGTAFGIAAGLPAMYGFFRYRSGKALLRMIDERGSSLEPAVFEPITAPELAAALPYFRAMGFYMEHQALSDAELAEHILAELEDPPHVLKGGPGFQRDLEVLRGDYARVWWEDTEADVAMDNDVYVGTLRTWAAISRGAFRPTDIRETWDGEEGPVRLHFNLDGKAREIQPQYMDDFIDIMVLARINALLEGGSVQFCVVDTGGQDFFVTVLTDDERRRLTEERGWPFLDLTSP